MSPIRRSLVTPSLLSVFFLNKLAFFFAMDPPPEDGQLPPPAYSEFSDAPPPDYFAAIELSEKIDLSSGEVVAGDGERRENC